MALIAPVLQNSGFHLYSIVRRRAVKEPQPARAEVVAQVVLAPQDYPKGAVPAATKNPSAKLHALAATFVRKGTADTIARTTSDSGVWRQMYDRESPAFLVVGYGATRRVTSQNTDPAQLERRNLIRYLRVQGLFDEGHPLIPLASWLPAMETGNPGRWKQIVDLISLALGDDYKFEGFFVDGEYQVEKSGVRLPMGALSDGYRAYIGWVGDMLYHICMGAPSGAKLVQNRGVVLVDEIDLHLHPEWQRRVIPLLAKTFPNIQFIFTTHSPIVVGSVEWSNIHVLSVDGPIQMSEAVSGLSAEQILLSPYFGLETTRSDRKLEELAALESKAQKAVSPAEPAGDAFAAAMDYMRSLTLGTEAINAPPAEPRRAVRASPARAKRAKTVKPKREAK
ncbi:MAG TPA: AAA family ATPase [Chthoniobacteraceae bacterium]|nr:AAA family ATPase [Chthoniobacteraceae bacterium]